MQMFTDLKAQILASQVTFLLFYSSSYEIIIFLYNKVGGIFCYSFYSLKFQVAKSMEDFAQDLMKSIQLRN